MVQLLDGISGAIRSVPTTVIVADITTATGRFNLARAAVGLVIAVSASISTMAFLAMLPQLLGRWAAFGSMAIVAAAGGLVIWLFLNESKPAKYID